MLSSANFINSRCNVWSIDSIQSTDTFLSHLHKSVKMSVQWYTEFSIAERSGACPSLGLEHEWKSWVRSQASFSFSRESISMWHCPGYSDAQFRNLKSSSIIATLLTACEQCSNWKPLCLNHAHPLGAGKVFLCEVFHEKCLDKKVGEIMIWKNKSM